MIVLVNIIDKILFLINKIGHEPVFHTDDNIYLYETNEGWFFSGDLFINGKIQRSP